MDGRVHPALLALNLAVEPQPASEMANSLEIIAAGGGSGKNCAFGSPIDSVGRDLYLRPQRGICADDVFYSYDNQHFPNGLSPEPIQARTWSPF